MLDIWFFLFQFSTIIYQQVDIQSRIRDIVAEFMQDETGKRGELGEQDVMQALRQRGLVEEIMKRLEIGGSGRDSAGSKVIGQPSRGHHKAKPATHFLNKDDQVASVPLKKGWWNWIKHYGIWIPWCMNGKQIILMKYKKMIIDDDWNSKYA